jgi:hypothetical protein
MSNAVDDYTFLKNFHHSLPSDKVLDTTWMYQNDSTNTYDGGRLEFDLSQFANNGTTNYQDWARALLVIPLVITINTSTNATGPTGGLASRSDIAVALKSSFVNLINNVLLLVNTRSFTSNNPLQNIPAYFTQLVSASQDDLKNKSYLGFEFLDNANSVDYITATAGTALNVKTFNGAGIVNNTALTPALEAAYVTTPSINKGDMNNTGFYRRARQFKNINQMATKLQDETHLKNETKDYTYCYAMADSDGGANAANDLAGRVSTYQVYYTTAVIKLSDITGGYFGQLGLIKGAHYVKLVMDVNCQGSLTLNKAVNGAAGTVNIAYGSGTFGNTCPLQINSTGINVTATEATTICASIGIAKPPNSLVSGYGGKQHNTLGLAHNISNARVYVPSVKLSLDAEQALISKGVSKKIQFTDFIQTTASISSNNNLQMVVTNSIKNATGLLIVPMISKNINGSLTGANAGIANTVSVLQSPFYPAVPCPLSLTNLNVNVGGQNVFQQQMSYTWEMFLEQISGLKSTNGGQEYGLSSCLISKSDWENMYRYYYVHFPNNTNDSVNSISLSCYNNNSVAVDLLIFVLQTKTALVDILTGQVESTNF